MSAKINEVAARTAALEAHRPGGSCEERRGCVSDPVPTTSAVPASLESSTVAMPIACTLRPGPLTKRVDEWNAVLEHAEERSPIERGVRLRMGPETPLSELSRLVVAEQECCRFFEFAITVDGRGLGLEVCGPDDAASIIEALFGAPS